MNKEIYTAIVFIRDNPAPAIKYRKISNEKKFVSFIENKYAGAYKINFYHRDTREFSHQIKIE
jgi:hypothetical protein